MSFAQGTPSVNTLINSSNCIVLGNTTSGTALTVQQLGAGAVMNVATTTGSSALFVSSTGQVGVGTTGPNGTAHVWNVAATGGPKLSIGDNTAFAPGGLHSIAALTSTLGAGNGNSIILGRTNATNDAFQMTFMNVAQGSTTNYLGFNAFGSSYTAALAITAGGNVGIGTTSPSALLQIRGTTNIGGQQGTPSSNTIASFLNDLTYGTNEAVDIEIGSQSRQIGNFGSVYKYRVGTINSGTAYGGSNFYINAVPTAAGAYTSDGTALNRMTIRYDGNVGIGLTNPREILQVNSTTSSTPNTRLSGGATWGTSAFIFDNTLSGFWHQNGYGNNPTTSARSAAYAAGQIICGSETNNNYENSYMAFQVCYDPQTDGTGGLGVTTERMRIKSNGNVGIGTTSPQFLLNSAQDISLTTDIAPNTAQFAVMGATTNAKRMVIGYDTQSAGNGYGFIKAGNYNVAWTNIVLQPNGGNVGIGVTNPSFGLDIYGTTSTSGTIRALTTSQGSGVAGSQVRLMEATDSYGFAFQNINALRLGLLYYNGAPGVECLSVRRDNGNVGIGVTNPSYQLSVTSNIYNQCNGGGFYGMNCGNLDGLIQGVYNGGSANPDGLSNSDMFIGVNYNQQTGQRIQTAGAGAGVAQIQLVGGNGSAGQIKFRCLTNGIGAVASIPTIATITTTGLGIGLTNPSYPLHVYTTGNGFWIQNSGTSYNYIGVTATGTAALNIRDVSSQLIQFYYGTTMVGSITTNGTTTAFNQTSDYRLKTNIRPLSNALDVISLMKPVRFNFKTDLKTDVDGFIAHELQDVVPLAVHGKKDAMNADGTINAQGVDSAFLIPYLVAGIQELSQENTALKQSLATVTARLDSLEQRLAAAGL